MKTKALLVTLVLAAAVAGLAVPASTARGSASGQAGPAAAGQWDTIYEELGVGINVPGERSLVADGAGNLHAIYGGMGLYYAHQVDGRWQHELVDGGLMAGRNASLAVDAQGRPHVCYQSGQESTELRYGWRDGAGWHTERVVANSYRGPCSIATNTYNEAAIAYRAGDDLVFASADAGTWHMEVLAAGARPDSISLLYGATGNSAEVAYAGAGLHYLYRDADGWHHEKVADEAYSASLASSFDNRLLAYTASSGVMVAYRSNNTWRVETVAPGDSVHAASLALKGGSLIYIAFYQGPSPDRLFYSYYDIITGWHTVDTGSTAEESSTYVTMALAGTTPVVAQCQACVDYMYFMFGPDAHLDVTRLQSGGNVKETVAATQLVGATQKLAVEGDGKVHLVYSDGSGGEPVYVYQDAAGWHREKVAGASVSDALALDKWARAHFAFADAAGLHYGLRDAAGWHFELVKPSLADNAALALDGQDRPVLAWKEPDGIRVASRDGEGWQTQVVHAGQAGSLALAVDAVRVPFVAYTDPGHLRYAYPYNGAWYRAYPAPLFQVVGRPSLAVNSQRAAYLGYDADIALDGYPDYRLKVAVRNGREWRAEDVATCGFFWCPISLAADQSGAVSAAYIVGFPFALSYARRAGGTWQAETLATSALEPVNQSLAVSLALDAAGRPTISYYSPDMLGIRVVRWGETDTTPTPTPTPTRMPTAACATPTPAPPYTGVPPAPGSIQRQIASCADDTYVRVDTQELLYDLSFVRMGARDNATYYVSGFLFRDVRIPRGADITSAKLRVQPEGHYNGTNVTVSIAGELHGQSGDFNLNNWWAHLRSRTSARVAWTLPASVSSPVDSPDLSAIIEEIVALPGWQPGNNIAVLIDGAAGQSGWVNWHAYDGKPAAAGQLSLTYQPK